MAKEYYTTPWGTVVAAYTEKPDKPYEDGGAPMFKVRLELDAQAMKQHNADLAKLAEGKSFKIKKPKLGVSVSQSDGKVTIVPSSKFKPAVFDGQLNKADGAKIGKDSIVRCRCELNYHDKGIGLQLISVQIRKLVEWQGSGGATSAGFETVDDGYVSEAGSGLPDETGGETEGNSALDI